MHIIRLKDGRVIRTRQRLLGGPTEIVLLSQDTSGLSTRKRLAEAKIGPQEMASILWVLLRQEGDVPEVEIPQKQW